MLGRLSSISPRPSTAAARWPTLTDKVQAVSDILVQNAAEVDTTLSRLSADVGVTLGNRAAEINAVLGNRSAELAELLDERGNALVQTLTARGGAITNEVADVGEPVVQALEERGSHIADILAQRGSDLVSFSRRSGWSSPRHSIAPWTRCRPPSRHSRAGRAIGEIGAVNDRVRIEMGSLLERLATTHSALGEQLDGSSRTLDGIEASLADRLGAFQSTMMNLADQTNSATERVGDQVHTLRDVSSAVLGDVVALSGRLEQAEQPAYPCRRDAAADPVAPRPLPRRAPRLSGGARQADLEGGGDGGRPEASSRAWSRRRYRAPRRRRARPARFSPTPTRPPSSSSLN